MSIWLTPNEGKLNLERASGKTYELATPAGARPTAADPWCCARMSKEGYHKKRKERKKRRRAPAALGVDCSNRRPEQLWKKFGFFNLQSGTDKRRFA